MPSGQKDASPNMDKPVTLKQREHGSDGKLENNDGRVKGEGWNYKKGSSPFGGQDGVERFPEKAMAKSVGVEPNDTIPKEGLGSKGVVGSVIE